MTALAVNYYGPGILSRTGQGASAALGRKDVEVKVGAEFANMWVFQGGLAALGNPEVRNNCDGEDYLRWIARSGAIPTANLFSLVVENKGDKTVVVEGFAVRTLEVRSPSVGVVLDCPVGDDLGPVRTVHFSFTSPNSPSISYTDQNRVQVSRLTFALKKHESQVVNIFADSPQALVRWDADILFTIDGRRVIQPLRGPDGHGPFAMSPNNTTDPSYVWSGKTWRSSSDPRPGSASDG